MGSVMGHQINSGFLNARLQLSALTLAYLGGWIEDALVCINLAPYNSNIVANLSEKSLKGQCKWEALALQVYGCLPHGASPAA